MRSLKSAAALLATCASQDELARLASVLGFHDSPLSLDEATRATFGLEDPEIDARIARGKGTLRVLLIETPPNAPPRDRVTALAGRLTSRVPHLLWLIIAAERGGPHLTIATWSAERARPRVAALVVDRRHVVDSDAETVCALAAAADESDLLTHAGWLDVLGRESLTRRFYRTMERVVGELARSSPGRACVEDRQALALLYASRLLFLSFLESKGWLNGDRRFLERGFAECMARGGNYHRRVLLPLFFGTLNTPPRRRSAAARAFGRIPFLNGGLFARTVTERRHRDFVFTDEAIGLLFGDLLTRYRFTAREDSTAWSEAAVDPEMLGKAFESLMQARERRVTGAFYTPQVLVTRTTRAALAQALAGPEIAATAAEAVLAGSPADERTAHALRERIEGLRVLDPACGSGAFLVHALEELAALMTRLGDGRPTAAIRRELLTRSIFGVDINPTAVWLCELRLWLSVVIESEEVDPLAVPALPNLDRNIRVGDALAGVAFDPPCTVQGGVRLAHLRERYARASGARKRTLMRELDRAERAWALAHIERELARCDSQRRELLTALRGRDLFGDRYPPSSTERTLLALTRERTRELRASRRALRDGGALPFSFATHFAEAATRGGFDLVLGNPPWVRLHRIPAIERASLRARYMVFAQASWERGAAAARAGAGFAAQVDLAALFVERSLSLLHGNGTLALLLPAKVWRSLAGGGVRKLLASRAHVVALDDWSESHPTFDAAVYPSLLLARRNAAPADRSVSYSETCADPSEPRGESRRISATVHRREGPMRWDIDAARLTLDDDTSSPWLVIPPAVRDAFDRVMRAGLPLADSQLGAPSLGVKCGCNEAFIVTLEGGEGELARVRSGRRVGEVERVLLRPLLRGERVASWHVSDITERLLWTHGSGGAPLDRLPPHADSWLRRWRRRLASRADARATTRWWALFRTGSASAEVSRLVWADFGRAPRALVLCAGDPTVALNSCYVLPCPDPRDAHALAALLNSALAAAWLNVLAEPARGGYRRYLAWTVALLPIPRDWADARTVLAPLAERAIGGEHVTDAELLAAACRAYRVRVDDMAPLLAWSAR